MAATQPLPNSMAGPGVPIVAPAGGKAILECMLESPARAAPALAAAVDGPSDEDLFLRVRGGDRAGLGQLVRRYERGLFALLVRMTGDPHRADDLFQETFLRAVKSAATFEAGKRFRPWLTAIAVNLVRDEGRRRKLRGEVNLDGAASEALQGQALAPEATPAEDAERADEAGRVRAALECLTGKEREVVLLHFYDGMTLTEVAEALAVPAGTVKSRLHAALMRLKGILAER